MAQDIQNTNHTVAEDSATYGSSPSGWKRFALRTFTIFVFALCIPINPKFYEGLFKMSLSKFTYHDIQSLAAFMPPQLITIETEEGVFGVLNYVNFILLLAIAAVLGLIWSIFDKKATHLSKIYYWVRVIARYRVAAGMVGWGLKKVFPMQMVYPTIGMLNTPFVDMAEKKLYWSHVGVSFEYTVFLGFAEVIPGLLLLHRKTAVLGAALAAVVCFNIALANHAYDAGVAVPAAYYIIISIFALSFDLPKIWNLLVGEKDVAPYRYYPSYAEKWQKALHLGLKSTFIIVFVFIAAILWGYGFYGNKNNYNIPNIPGIAGTKGYYDVTEFRLNNKLIPYSPEDTIRWQDATFETWSSLSYRTNRKAEVDRMIGYSPLRTGKGKEKSKFNEFANNDETRRRAHPSDKKKRDLQVTRWEVGGMAGERRYFFYERDSLDKSILYLQNKNKNHSDETQVLRFSQPSKDRIILEGINEFKDSIYVVLDRNFKKYPLNEGRLSLTTAY